MAKKAAMNAAVKASTEAIKQGLSSEEAIKLSREAVMMAI